MIKYEVMRVYVTDKHPQFTLAYGWELVEVLFKEKRTGEITKETSIEMWILVKIRTDR